MASARPLLLVDVDGVISLFGFDLSDPPETTPVIVDGLPHFLSNEAARHLARLTRTFECVWCTGWEDRAEENLPRLLGWDPGRVGWPHLSFGGPDPAARHWKLAAIEDFAGLQRPVAWVDDAHDSHCEEWVRARPGPTLLVRTDPAVGLTLSQVERLEAWALQTAES